MTEIIKIPAQETSPSIDRILLGQGISDINLVDDRIISLADKARDIYSQISIPIGIIKQIEKNDFESIYFGEGMNDSPGPIENIFKNANHLALFALTVGQPVCDEINKLFDKHEYPLGSMLDSAASAGADIASDYLANWFKNHLKEKHDYPKANEVICYSPGYCGWHVSAQKALFSFLGANKIGITLRQSCLMEPLKSISGALIDGNWDIHIFNNEYSSCGQCPSQPCAERIEMIKQKHC